jgi:hypothetical protein
MAKVEFTGIVANITGKLSGSVFQQSFGGPQLHVKRTPINRQSYLQQTERVQFAELTASWRNLTSLERASWAAAAPTAAQGFNLFVETNTLIIRSGSDQVNSYTAPVTPITLHIELVGVIIDPLNIQFLPDPEVNPAGWNWFGYWSGWKFPSVRSYSSLKKIIPRDLTQWDSDASAFDLWSVPAYQPEDASQTAKFALVAVHYLSGQVVVSNYLEIEAVPF